MLRRGALGLLLVSAACGQRVPAAITSFSATPASIGAGDTTQLAWQSTKALGCSISPDVGTVSISGTVAVSPGHTTRYVLTCDTATAAVIVAVQQPVKIDSFTATPAMTSAGSPVELVWAAQNASSCFITGVGTVMQSGTRTVFPMASTTWQLTCEGFRGPAFKLAATEAPPAGLTVPTEPAALAGDGRLALSWKQGAGKANVYFARATGVRKATVGMVAGGQVFSDVQSPFEVSGLVNGTEYFFTVASALDGFESAESVEASGTPAGGPPLGDPYYARQWHLVNTGQKGGASGEDIRAPQAWAQGFKGEGVRVAVIDEGVDFQHEDLKSNVSQALSYDYLGNAPLSLAEHGTCVAGLIAARDDNGLGMRGVAPRSNLVSYNLLQDLTVANELDAMVRGKQTNGVSSNSWGDAADGTGLLSFAEQSWLNGVTEGTQTGRAGLGTVYLWAAGNGGDGNNVDNANYDGQTNSRFVLSIAGVGDDGRKVSYSEDGANLLVSAPTMGRASHGLSTTDLTGSLGYNDGSVSGEAADLSYTDLMNGTSGATPIVAGIAALVLQANPQLTWRDVRRVLAYSARKNDSFDPGWADNLAGLHLNHKYGFGVADAAAAVALARGFTAGAPELSTATAPVSPGLSIPDNDATGVSSAITVSGSAVGHVEFIEVTVSISHPRAGDLEIFLDRGSGPVDQLSVPHTCAPVGGVEQCSQVQGWTFGTLRHLDEVANGTWTLRVRDRLGGNTGTLQSWKLTFWGRP